MRASAILTGLAVLTCTAARTEDLPSVNMKSRIEQVVLYSSGAAVTRGAKGAIPEGRSRLSIPEPPS